MKRIDNDLFKDNKTVVQIQLRNLSQCTCDLNARQAEQLRSVQETCEESMIYYAHIADLMGLRFAPTDGLMARLLGDRRYCFDCDKIFEKGEASCAHLN